MTSQRHQRWHHMTTPSWQGPRGSTQEVHKYIQHIFSQSDTCCCKIINIHYDYYLGWMLCYWKYYNVKWFILCSVIWEYSIWHSDTVSFGSTNQSVTLVFSMTGTTENNAHKYWNIQIQHKHTEANGIQNVLFRHVKMPYLFQ